MSIYAATMAAYFQRRCQPLKHAEKLLARDAQVSPRTAANWLQGLNTPNGASLVRLMAACPELYGIINNLVVEMRRSGNDALATKPDEMPTEQRTAPIQDAGNYDQQHDQLGRQTLKRLFLAAALALATGTAAHAQSAPSDSSLAQLQQQDQKANDTQQDQITAIANHSLSLVQGIVTELEHAGLKFTNMQQAISPSDGSPSTIGGEVGGLLNMDSSAGQTAKYIGGSNEIAVVAMGASLEFVFQPDNGTPIMETFTFDGTNVSFANIDSAADGGPTATAKGYDAGSIDQAITSDIKQDVKNSLAPPSDDQSDDTGVSDQGDSSQVAAPAATPSVASDSKAAPPAPLGPAVLNTLMHLQAEQRRQEQGQTPTASANSNAPNVIGNNFRPCWSVDAGAPGLDNFSVELKITTDATGTVRQAEVAPVDQPKMSDPVYSAFANRAVAAVMNYQCATMLLPASMLGHPNTFFFTFKP